ncbi:hypothetical protein AZF37_01880 [endosymbiont 'TC1' of Trimyema compressum]|uniref:tRNA 2-thiouridine(34) synthase MnmA n=1 Tax=endosymbiont 'TC1' of Trimyema compressum TaxID=243899 RepID=UPI0007F09889|nr:tRNA 2-thiouridine(34) synthase MnmA [endosymbiont 'TC1' of Trimyema compressum]AMP20092.1 hypothetical protein AZF37_01880 [endosymbiont 'TC1' of Trimyema compressum]
MKKKVLCAMSGGVDSSVATALLLEAGYEVAGVTCQIWLDDLCSVTSGKSCCSNDAIEDARQTAHQLGIKHYVFNYRELFEDKVIKPFCNSYLEGKTPNPCMDCNRYIRSQDLLSKALGMGFDYMATGHYVRRLYNEETQEYVLKTGFDQKKDQSYFLYQMNQEQLSHMLFPLGDFEKSYIREIARKHNFEVAEKKDSQDICFVLEGTYGDFIETYTGKEKPPASIYYKDGVFLGRGKPIYNYTIGQRKGLGIAFGNPVYVIGIDSLNNRVTLGEKEDFINKGLLCDDVFFISERPLEEEREVLVKVRYKSPPKKGIYWTAGSGFKIKFTEPVEGVTIGQSAVLYDLDKETVLGGGRITKPL